jgi:hypothetical protein
MARKKTFTSDERLTEEIRLQQLIINCDDYIIKYFDYPDIVGLWTQRKERALYELQDLQTDEII